MSPRLVGNDPDFRALASVAIYFTDWLAALEAGRCLSDLRLVGCCDVALRDTMFMGLPEHRHGPAENSATAPHTMLAAETIERRPICKAAAIAPPGAWGEVECWTRWI